MDPAGIEPVTYCLQSSRSSQLSYGPKITSFAWVMGKPMEVCVQNVQRAYIVAKFSVNVKGIIDKNLWVCYDSISFVNSQTQTREVRMDNHIAFTLPAKLLPKGRVEIQQFESFRDFVYVYENSLNVKELLVLAEDGREEALMNLLLQPFGWISLNDLGEELVTDAKCAGTVLLYTGDMFIVVNLPRELPYLNEGGKLSHELDFNLIPVTIFRALDDAT